MYIHTIGLKNIRNLCEQEHEFSNRFNIIIGNNGAGKTSWLEAIYLTGTARSFRTRHLDKIIQEGSKECSIRIKLLTRDLQNKLPIQAQKTYGEALKFTLGGNSVHNVAEITRLLPLQLMTQESYNLLDEGPHIRRNFIDQGLFYSDSEFLLVWKKTMQALKQRNAALKSEVSTQELEAWETELSRYGEILSLKRKDYIHNFKEIWLEVLEEFMESKNFSIHLKQGWSEQETLKESLNRHQEQDRYRGFTSVGPHRADLILNYDRKDVRDILSRGQKKLVIYSLRLGQSTFLQQKANIYSIYLIDEMLAELDAEHRQRVFKFLNHLRAQVFITATDLDEVFSTLKSNEIKMFHVEQGLMKSMI